MVGKKGSILDVEWLYTRMVQTRPGICTGINPNCGVGEWWFMISSLDCREVLVFRSPLRESPFLKWRYEEEGF